MLKEEIPWEERASCTDRDPKLFDGEDEYANRTAKTICLQCPVRSNCLIDAMVNEELYGIWGAHTPDEREKYKSDFTAKYSRDMPLLKAKYKRKDLSLGSRQEKRLQKCREARRILHPGVPRYDEFRQVIDEVIANPEATSVQLGQRIGKSASWVEHALIEAWRRAS
jgi:WhiB family redox-sensing transcriptional regulator